MPQTGSKRYRQPLYLLVPVALVAVALWGFWPRAQPVETAVVKESPLEVDFSEEARARLRDRYAINAPFDGVVKRIGLRPGDAVRAGQALATMQPLSAALFDPASRALADARLRSAESELQAAVATLAAATSERLRAGDALRRGEALAARGLIATEAVETLRTQSARAEAAWRSAEAQRAAAMGVRDAARAVLALQGRSGKDGQEVALPSPIDGQVIHRYVESETPVRAGQALLEVGDPHSLEVVAEVLTTDAVRIGPGTAVRLDHWGGDGVLDARVAMVEPGGFTKVSALGVEEQRVLVVMTLSDPPGRWARLADGFQLEADFVVWRADKVPTVPTAALFRDGPGWAVYAVDGGRARLRPVRIGHVGLDRAELLEGLPMGATVVIYPGDRVRDGVRVAGTLTP